MDNSLVQFVVRILITGVSVLAVSALLPGIKVKSYGTAVLFGVILGLFNAIAWFLLAPLTWPFAILTLGLGILVVNAAVFLFAGKVLDGVKVDGWLPALLGSLGVSFFNWILFWIAGVSK